MNGSEELSGRGKPRLGGVRFAMAILLTAVAGFVDIFCYLSLYRVFVANMSGNSIELGRRLVEGDWAQVFHRGLPIAAFVAGLLACAFAIEVVNRWGMRHALGVSLMVEMLCLLAFLALGVRVFGLGRYPAAEPGAEATVLVGLSAFAMGTQNASLRAAGVLNIYTTHVTGTLTRMSQRAVEFLFAVGDRRRGSAHRVRCQKLRQAGHLAVLWLAYVAGAAAGGWSWTDMGVLAFGVPVGVVAITTGLSFLGRGV